MSVQTITITSETQFHNLLRNVKKLPNGWYQASCPNPAHGKGKGDLHGSFNYVVEGPYIRCNCHTGCDVSDITKALGIDPSQVYHKTIVIRSNAHKPDSRILDGQWIYYYEDGSPMGAKLKWLLPNGKRQYSWHQVKKDGSIGAKGIGKKRRVPYNLPDMIAERHLAAKEDRRAVFVLQEGEKACDLASTNLASFTAEDWETTLDALDIRITVYPDRVDVEGFIPLVQKDGKDALTSGKYAFVSDTSPFCG